jgi:hypothetical protein
MFEITGGIPEPIIDELEEAQSPEKMAGLNWKSDAAATVIRPLPRGTGDPPKRHQRGKISKTRIEIRSGFSLYASDCGDACASHSEAATGI